MKSSKTTVEFTKDDLINFLPQFQTFVGIDSDGCIFDTMEVKQKDFFHPAIIRHWALEAIETEVRAAAEFTYLYSTFRGLNRFLGLCKTFELLNDWPAAALNPDSSTHFLWAGEAPESHSSNPFFVKGSNVTTF